jgi:thiamine-monophosphate kinase
LILPKEFDLIARHFTPLAGPAALGLRDDAAILAPPPGRDLAITVDTMVAGVHFPPDDNPDLVARKLLRVNLSDLAAMGATPLGYLLALSVPRATPETWFAAFAAGLAEDQARYGITLLGGDTTSTPGPVSLTVTMLGHTAPGQALTRSGARPGDLLFVTGTVGDGVLGLYAIRGEIPDSGGTLAARYRLPSPRVGLAFAGIATACMDISDGLVQDLGHICRASGVAAQVDAWRVPLSPAARATGRLATCLAGGDDYELLLAVPPAQALALTAACAAADVPVTQIGAFVDGAPDVVVVDASGARMDFAVAGWSHF